MQTTFDIDQDILDAARKIAFEENTSLSNVLSRLARKGLLAEQTNEDFGFKPFTTRAKVDNRDVEKLREDQAI